MSLVVRREVVLMSRWEIQVTQLRAESLQPPACPSKNHWGGADAILVASVCRVVECLFKGFS